MILTVPSGGLSARRHGAGFKRGHKITPGVVDAQVDIMGRRLQIDRKRRRGLPIVFEGIAVGKDVVSDIANGL